jgi:hypothetical protein
MELVRVGRVACRRKMHAKTWAGGGGEDNSEMDFEETVYEYVNF